MVLFAAKTDENIRFVGKSGRICTLLCTNKSI